MTGTILPPRETAVLRGVAKSAAVFFALMLIERIQAGRATSELEIAGLLRMDTRTVHRQLSGLSAAGLVTAQGADRWMLTPEGRGTLFGETLSDPHLSIEESEPLLLVSDSAAQIVHQIEDRLTINVAKNVQSSSSDLDCTKCANVPQILRAAAELFEAEVLVNEIILKRDPEYVLGWVAKAWNDFTRPGSTLRSPAGLIYKRLCELETLPVMYQKNPARGLPASFLREIGMLTEADVAEQAEAKTEAKPINYLGGEWSDLMSGRKESAEVRFEGWVSVFRELPKLNGVSFHGNERVELAGNVMRVYLREVWQGRVSTANQFASEVASQIYAELSNIASARVEFVEEVMA